MSRKEVAHKAMCLNSTKENKKSKSMKSKASKAVLRAARGKALEALTEFKIG